MDQAIKQRGKVSSKYNLFLSDDWICGVSEGIPYIKYNLKVGSIFLRSLLPLPNQGQSNSFLIYLPGLFPFPVPETSQRVCLVSRKIQGVGDGW